MRKSLLWVIIAAFLVGMAESDVANAPHYWLLAISRPTEKNRFAFQLELPWEKVNEAAAAPTKNGTLVFNEAARNAERAIQQAPPTDATTAQIQILNNEKKDKLKEVFGTVRAQHVSMSFPVQDVLILDDDQVRVGFESTFGGGLRELARHGDRLVIGTLVTNTDPPYTDVEKKEIAAANESCQRRIKEIGAVRDDKVATVQKALAGPKNYDRRESEIKSIQRDAKINIDAANEAKSKGLKRIREKAATRRPTHLIYCLTRDAAVDKWKRGQTKNLRGVVQTVLLHTDGGIDRMTRIVGFEYIVILDSGDSVPDAPAPKTVN